MHHRSRVEEIATAMTVQVVVKRARNTFETIFRRDETRFRLSAVNAQFARETNDC
jgi:hypothetical protein